MPNFMLNSNMDYQDLWEKICFNVNKRKNVSEAEFQFVMAQIFDNLGWREHKGELLQQYVMQLGSQKGYADIVLVKDEIFAFVVELKRPLLQMNEKFAGQLISYMKQLETNVGVLIGDTLCLYYGKNKIADIHFDEQSILGVDVIKLLSKENFSMDKIMEFCDTIKQKQQEQETVKNEIGNFCSTRGKEYVVELVKKELSASYSNEMIDKILAGINISINRIDDFQEKTAIIHGGTNSYGKNKTGESKRYDYKGISKLNRIVLAVVNDYIKNERIDNIYQLKVAFPDALQGKLGVVDTLEKAREIFNRTKHWRHFTASNETIKLQDSTYAVCTQWGAKPNTGADNFLRFLEHAKRLGFDIKEII